MLKAMYNGVFGNVVTCGPRPDATWTGSIPDIMVQTNDGYHAYHCMGKAIERFPDYEGEKMIKLRYTTVLSKAALLSCARFTCDIYATYFLLLLNNIEVQK